MSFKSFSTKLIECCIKLYIWIPTNNLESLKQRDNLCFPLYWMLLNLWFYIILELYDVCTAQLMNLITLDCCRYCSYFKAVVLHVRKTMKCGDSDPLWHLIVPVQLQASHNVYWPFFYSWTRSGERMIRIQILSM